MVIVRTALALGGLGGRGFRRFRFRRLGFRRGVGGLGLCGASRLRLSPGGRGLRLLLMLLGFASGLSLGVGLIARLGLMLHRLGARLGRLSLAGVGLSRLLLTGRVFASLNGGLRLGGGLRPRGLGLRLKLRLSRGVGLGLRLKLRFTRRRNRALLLSRLSLTRGVGLSLLLASGAQGALLAGQLRLTRRISLGLLLARRVQGAGLTGLLSLTRLIGLDLLLTGRGDGGGLLALVLTTVLGGRQRPLRVLLAVAWAVALTLTVVSGRRGGGAARDKGSRRHGADGRGVGDAAVTFLGIDGRSIGVLFVPGAPIGVTLLVGFPLPLLGELRVATRLPLGRLRGLVTLVRGGIVELTRPGEIGPRPLGARLGLGVVQGATIAVVDDRQAALIIGVGVVGSPHQIRLVRARIVIVVAVAV